MQETEAYVQVKKSGELWPRAGRGDRNLGPTVQVRGVGGNAMCARCPRTRSPAALSCPAALCAVRRGLTFEEAEDEVPLGLWTGQRFILVETGL